MNFFFYTFMGIVAALLLLLGWSLIPRKKRKSSSLEPADSLEEPGRHSTYLPQVRRALTPEDVEFLASHASAKLARRIRRERRRVALTYLSALEGDFQKLLRLARVIAVLSPEIGASHEFERFRLGVQFSLRCRVIRAELLLGFAPLLQLGSLAQVVSGFAVRIETAITELGERAALATELASSLERRGVDLR